MKNIMDSKNEENENDAVNFGVFEDEEENDLEEDEEDNTNIDSYSDRQIFRTTINQILEKVNCTNVPLRHLNLILGKYFENEELVYFQFGQKSPYISQIDDLLELKKREIPVNVALAYEMENRNNFLSFKFMDSYKSFYYSNFNSNKAGNILVDSKKISDDIFPNSFRVIGYNTLQHTKSGTSFKIKCTNLECKNLLEGLNVEMNKVIFNRLPRLMEASKSSKLRLECYINFNLVNSERIVEYFQRAFQSFEIVYCRNEEVIEYFDNFSYITGMMIERIFEDCSFFNWFLGLYSFHDWVSSMYSLKKMNSKFFKDNVGMGIKESWIFNSESKYFLKNEFVKSELSYYLKKYSIIFKINQFRYVELISRLLSVYEYQEEYDDIYLKSISSSLKRYNFIFYILIIIFFISFLLGICPYEALIIDCKKLELVEVFNINSSRFERTPLKQMIFLILIHLSEGNRDNYKKIVSESELCKFSFSFNGRKFYYSENEENNSAASVEEIIKSLKEHKYPNYSILFSESLSGRVSLFNQTPRFNLIWKLQGRVFNVIQLISQNGRNETFDPSKLIWDWDGFFRFLFCKVPDMDGNLYLLIEAFEAFDNFCKFVAVGLILLSISDFAPNWIGDLKEYLSSKCLFENFKLTSNQILLCTGIWGNNDSKSVKLPLPKRFRIAKPLGINKRLDLLKEEIIETIEYKVYKFPLNFLKNQSLLIKKRYIEFEEKFPVQKKVFDYSSTPLNNDELIDRQSIHENFINEADIDRINYNSNIYQLDDHENESLSKIDENIQNQEDANAYEESDLKINENTNVLPRASLQTIISSSKQLLKFAEDFKDFEVVDFEGKSLEEIEIMLTNLLDLDKNSMKTIARILHSKLQ